MSNYQKYNEDEDELTLADIRIMLNVLKKYLALFREIDSTLRQFSYTSGYAGRSIGNTMPTWEQLISMVMAESQKKQQTQTQAQDITEGILSQEELQDVKRIVNKIKKKPSKQVP